MKPFVEKTNITLSQNSSSKFFASKKRRCNLLLKVDASMVSSLQERDKTCVYVTTDDQRQIRKHIFKWLIAKCKMTLDLRTSTIEHCMRLFDLYVAKSGKFMDTLEEAHIYLLACLFISCKYMEVYPPTVTDFEYVSKYKASSREFILLEVQILKKVDYQLNLSLLSDWIYIYSGRNMKEWAILFIPHLKAEESMEKFAIQIIYQRIMNYQVMNEDQCKDLLQRIYENQIS